MKKNVLVIAGLAVLSTSAFASKARMEALGQGSATGSYYIADSRSIFSNPADLNGMKNYIVTEWGTSAVTDAATTPRAEGGFFRDAGAFAYGLYLGSDTSRVSHTGTYLDQSNAMDLFLAGDMGIKWGARVHYAGSKDETTATAKKHSALGLGLGLTQGDLSAYLDMDLADKSTGDGTTAGNTDSLKPSFTLGASYAWSGYTFFGEYTSNKHEKKEGTTTITTTTSKNSEIVLGAGRVHEINPTARLITDVTLHMEKATNIDTTYGTDVLADAVKKYNRLPVTLGVEADATSWLVLRGSVSQNVIISDYTNTAGKKVTKANSTDVNAGATLNFGKLKVDGTVGTTGASRGATTDGTEQGVLATDNLMTRVGVTYMF
jgi:hypothetical protein